MDDIIRSRHVLRMYLNFEMPTIYDYNIHRFPSQQDQFEKPNPTQTIA